MSNPELIKKSGRVFIASAFAFATLLTGWDPIAIPGSVVSAILLAVGMSRLRSAYSETISQLGRNFLSLGVLGPVLRGILLVSTPLLISVTGIQEEEGMWVLIFRDRRSHYLA
jgi:hypothetical protein